MVETFLFVLREQPAASVTRRLAPPPAALPGAGGGFLWVWAGVKGRDAAVWLRSQTAFTQNELRDVRRTRRRTEAPHTGSRRAPGPPRAVRVRLPSAPRLNSSPWDHRAPPAPSFH
ncbi:hypothetical protein OJAV_G00164590 [Oryzias javanicus]|uniref:Uncharacterized protein n=1 Tax=Oryzias javanicus TaxID=123683 RepID=A0A437CK83_ORYJA|nr:hypothetical protein OJAV_G00164590 [Oryzias javanicus]